ncbi:putative sulfate exporter family transporter [Roseibacterium beibuensis]|uniref:Sulfate exporter family transporter n=1 Tax=[Roseibacterium] beibuensis TaxID=1193142 RepID=A0ABP9LNJ5_9RHOB|nr:putative sulfate exporter family transporter [Roseibacterium beibuensis]MCS6627932.1 putative sulfate exporter family transporter [Roseibacterium beibuensis]
MPSRAITINGATAWASTHWRGVLIAAIIALAAKFIANTYGAPAMLFALLIGMAFTFLEAEEKTAPGIAFAARSLLRIGVALLGLQLTFADISQLGVVAMIGVAGLLATTLAFGALSARLAGAPVALGLLTGGSVAICGASAALAISAILVPRHAAEKDVLVTVVGVTAFSTIAMILYPVIFASLGFSEIQSGYLVGATIHDVAQVVGAGYSISEDAGDIATFTKLLRVALLPIVLLAIALSFRQEAGGTLRLPWFLVAFILLMLLGNLVPLPETLLLWIGEATRFLFLTAIAALGMKTSLGSLFQTGKRSIALIAVQSLFLLGCALVVARYALV